MSTSQPEDKGAESARILAEVAERSSRLMAEFLAKQTEANPSAATDEFGIAKAYMDLAANMLANPHKLAEAQMAMIWDYARLWQSFTSSSHDGEPIPT